MRYATIVFILMLTFAYVPFSAQGPAALTTEPTTVYVNSSEGLLQDVPYVWQEINGYCAWAATSMAMKYAGADVDLHDVFAASTIGFSYAYIHYNDTILTYPGVMYTQAEPTDFIADLYGINYTIYLGSSLSGVEQIQQVWESEGISVGLLDGEVDAFNLMRTTIDLGYPLLISVDPSWLPAVDYDFLRAEGLTGGGHGVLIVGYDDAQGTATLMDPGVGSFGDLYGYPEDGRGNYTDITYTALNEAWSSRYYISNTFFPGGGPVADFSDRMGMMIRDKLLGVGTIYSPDSSSAFLWNYGEAGFRRMSEDFSPSGLASYLHIFDGIYSDSARERLFKAAVLLFMGLGIETSITLQGYSFRAGVSKLPDILPDVDLGEFVSAASDATPHFDALSNNNTLIHPGNISVIEGLISTTLFEISQQYNSTGNLDAAIDAFSTDLESISSHLLGIADSWLAAGNALANIWPNNMLIVYGPWIAIGGIVVGITIVALFTQIRKTKSQ
ncbi:MAG: C39 family peptidase [Candidatus Thorarchaeota archaeon]|nr:C39 family peptidase [Candidatus Thorarchaeota archaeon]